MTIEEIRKNAPDGATHYSISNGSVEYFNHLLFGFFPDLMLINGNWVETYLNPEELKPLN